MNDKPIIRHCRNCKWGKPNIFDGVKCQVTYKYILDDEQRIKALFCKYYKQKEIKIQDGI